MTDDKPNGHPRTRGARSQFQDEPNMGGNYPLNFGTLTSFDGAPIFYCSEGEGDPLVFCYGIACSTLHWTYQIDYFRKNHRCIWFDYRGHRHTPIPADLDTLSIDASVRDLKAVLDFLEIESAVLLGHSMGVSVALEFARRYPKRVKKLVLANGTAKNPLDTLLGGSYLAPAFSVLSRLEKEKPEWIERIWKIQEKSRITVEALGLLGFNTNLAHPDDIRTYSGQVASLPPVVLTRMMDDYRHFDATPWLHEILQPALIISGEKDRVTPAETQKLMAQLLPNSELFTVNQGSHCVPLDQADLVNLLVERFIKA